MKARRFDEAIWLLENEVVGGKKRVRQILAEILTLSSNESNATATHEALLRLGTNRDGRVRLVTTNFDRLFKKTIAEKSLDVKPFRAPLLPVLKSGWNGLVYLHGLLPEEPTSEKSTTEELYNLVVSSADFGRAYLTGGWAERFISELLHNYTICFIGYSLNDPMMRYIVNAWAEDRLSGESDKEIFAFVDYAKGKKSTRESEWKARQVTPILYRRYNKHFYLHRTLKKWADIYQDSNGKENIVLDYAKKNPSLSTSKDDFVGRILWALSDPGGLPAKCFAERERVPSLDWLDVLCDNRYGMEDLDRFGIARSPVHDAQRDPLQFSLLRRPVSSCDRGPRMALVGASADSVILDDVMRRLGDWLTRHLNNPELLLWVANHGGCLHSEFAEAVARRLDEIAELERNGKQDEIERTRTHAPDAIPSPGMRTYWRLAVTGHLSRQDLFLDFYFWRDQFQRDGLTPSIRIRLCEMLRPRISLGRVMTLSESDDGWLVPAPVQDEEEPAHCICPEIVLSASYGRHGVIRHGVIRHGIRRMSEGNQRWGKALPDLMEAMNMLLRETLDLMCELEKADDKSDRTYIQMPSISDHPQNKHYNEWTILITLCRDAWLAMAENNPDDARLVAERWWREPYPIFKRLALFAAAQDDVIPVELALDWLTAEKDGWWLWSPETKREAIRLLDALASRLEGSNLAKIEQAILQGPPRDMHEEATQEEHWNDIVGRSIWLRLAKLERAGAVLHEETQTRLKELAKQGHDCSFEPDQREEFPIWIEARERSLPIPQVAPRRRRELVQWLREDHKFDFVVRKDDWKWRCQKNFPTAACALCALAKEDVWPPDCWRAALFIWSQESPDGLTKRSWRYLAPVLAEAPDDLVQSVDRQISRWLESVAAVFDEHEELFTKLCARVLELSRQQGNGDDETDGVSNLTSKAINHPVGKVTEALLCRWNRQPLEDKQDLSDDLHDIFTALCNPDVKNFWHGRVLLATRAIALFRVDREWTTEHLLPLFDWYRPSEACAAWQGFLWSLHLDRPLDRPLMKAIRPHFLATTQHYDELDKWRAQYSDFLAITALSQPDIFDGGELAKAAAALPPEGLHQTAYTLVRELESVDEPQRGDYWENRMRPCLEAAWPQSRHHVTPDISRCFAELCVATRDKFRKAIEKLDWWLQRLPYQGSAVGNLYEYELCKKFPAEALRFLDKTVSDDYQSLDEVRNCLQSIRQADSDLATEPAFQRLENILRRGGIELD